MHCWRSGARRAVFAAMCSTERSETARALGSAFDAAPGAVDASSDRLAPPRPDRHWCSAAWPTARRLSTKHIADLLSTRTPSRPVTARYACSSPPSARGSTKPQRARPCQGSVQGRVRRNVRASDNLAEPRWCVNRLAGALAPLGRFRCNVCRRSQSICKRDPARPSGRNPEQAGDETCLGFDVFATDVPNLPFPDHRHGFVSCQRLVVVQRQKPSRSGPVIRFTLRWSCARPRLARRLRRSHISLVDGPL